MNPELLGTVIPTLPTPLHLLSPLSLFNQLTPCLTPHQRGVLQAFVDTHAILTLPLHVVW